MEKSRELLQTYCSNCSVSLKGSFCHNCGQRVRDNSNRSLGPLIVDFLNNIFFFDSHFFLSIRYLIQFPSRITVEFLEGKRKKFISPVTLFLFFNLIYFFVSPLSDYSLSLYDQTYSQPYSVWTKEWVNIKLQNIGLDEQAYGVIYQNTSDNISKSIMIINVPIIAIFVYLMAFRRRRFYFDSLIFSFHFFSLFICSWIMLDWVGSLIDFFASQDDSIVSKISFYLFAFLIPLFYAILGIKKFMNIHWYWSFFAGIGVIIAVNLANLIYRIIIFIVTFLVT